MNYSRRNPYSISERNQNQRYNRQFGPYNSPYQNEYDQYSQRNVFYNDNDDDHYENDYDVYASDRFQHEDEDYGYEGNYRTQQGRFPNGREFNAYGRTGHNNFAPSNYGRENGYSQHGYFNRENRNYPNQRNNNYGNYSGRNFYDGYADRAASNFGRRPFQAFENEYNNPFQTPNSEYSRRRRRSQYAY